MAYVYKLLKRNPLGPCIGGPLVLNEAWTWGLHIQKVLVADVPLPTLCTTSLLSSHQKLWWHVTATCITAPLASHPICITAPFATSLTGLWPTNVLDHHSHRGAEEIYEPVQMDDSTHSFPLLTRLRRVSGPTSLLQKEYSTKCYC